MATISSHNSTNSPPISLSTPAAEPGPDWLVARRQWGAFWELHWIGFGIGFALIAIHSVLAILFADKKKAFTRRLLFFAVNFLLMTLGIVRSLYLWIDPYESSENNVQVTLWVNRILFGLGFPCLTSAFCLVHVAFLEVSKIKLGSKKLHSLPFVCSIILFHFAIVFVSDITVALEADKKELLIVCQSFFIVWGFVNSFAFLFSGGQILRKSNETRKQLSQINNNATTTNHSKGRKGATLKVAKITMVTAILSLACCALQIYSMVGVYGLYSTIVNPPPWPWYAFQTGFRVVELAMGFTLAYTVVQPSEYGRNVLFRSCCKKTRSNPCEVASIGTHNGSIVPDP